MAISKQEYAKKIGVLGEQIIIAAERYAKHGEAANFKTEKDLEEFKRKWLLIVDDFRVVQSGINELDIPEGYEEKGQELRKAYQKYVDYIEEKTMKFGVEAMDSGEIDLIQKLEMEQSKKIKKLTQELTKEMFGK